MRISKNKCYYCDKKIKGKKDKEENFNRIEVKDGYSGGWYSRGVEPAVPVTDYTYYRCKVSCSISWIPKRDPHVDNMSEKINELMRIASSALCKINSAIEELSTLHNIEVKRVSTLEIHSYLDGKKGKK